ncbi:MAG: DUF3079 domain-containing protein [candidate division WS1 bacterium]|nr:DUF3079 domain-containing protein [candidate division WS1 bacterium]
MQKPSKWKHCSSSVVRPSRPLRTRWGCSKSCPTAALRARPGPHLLSIRA